MSEHLLIDFANPLELAAFATAAMLAVWLLFPSKDSW